MIHFKFNRNKAIAALLHITTELCKNDFKTDIHKVFKILYFAERKHLATYARPITGDRFIAMKNGPVPSVQYDWVKALKGGNVYLSDDLKKNFSIDNGIVLVPLNHADLDEFSDSDLEFLNESIRIHKNKSFETLTIESHGKAWKNAEGNNVMDYCEIAEEENASPAICELIKINAENDQFAESLI